MALGDQIRRNVASVSAYERRRLRDAIVELNSRNYPDGVSKWRKQDQIHQATEDWARHSHSGGHHGNVDIHGGPAFLPWHRELCNRFEDLLREVDTELSLHYWDWTEDPRQAKDGSGYTVNLFSPNFMGTANGNVELPFSGFPQFDRRMAGGQDAPSPPRDNEGNLFKSDIEIINSTNNTSQSGQWQVFRQEIELYHNFAHGYIGGSIGAAHTAFEDPFVFLLHSNVDRLWAMWQTVPGEDWRLDENKIYGDESEHEMILKDLEPWAGKTSSQLRPWAPPDNQQDFKTSKDRTVVIPRRYDTKVVDNNGVRAI